MAKTPQLQTSQNQPKTPPPSGVTKLDTLTAVDLLGLPPSEDCYKFLLNYPINASAEFVYNYFVRDEMVNGDALLQNKVPQNEQKKLKFLLKKPRYVKLTFSNPYTGQTKYIPGGIAQHAAKVIDNSGNSDYAHIVFQDFNVIDSVKKKLDQSFPGDDPVEKKKKISKLVNNSAAPLNAYFLSSLTSLPDQPESAALEVGGKTVVFNPYSDLGKQSLISSINNQFYPALLTAASFDTYADHYDTPQASQASVPKKNYGYFAEPYVDPEPLTKYNNYTEMLLVGYEINRYIVDENGIMSYEKSMMMDQVDGRTTLTFYDTDVLYGVTYVYSIKAVYDVKLNLVDVNTGKYVTARYLLSSRNSDFAQVACKTMQAPPPPGDLKFFWDSSEMALHISWTSPINTLRDTKGFKIFKRSSINEPYQLVKMFDFNDAINRYPLPDFLSSSGVVQVTPETDFGTKLPVLTWYDHDFDIYGTQMYAVVSYSAHNYDSVLSSQFQVKYNQVTGRVELELVSRWGAPIAYPNINVNRSSLFVNTMVSDGMDRLRIYFDPAARRAIRKSNGVTKAVDKLYHAYEPTSGTGRYVLNITNMDLLKHEQVNIKVQDLSGNTI